MQESYSFLIVESSLAARVIIRSQFLDLGHRLDIAWDFESAMEYVGSKLYDLILIDSALDQRTLLIQKIKKIWRIGKQTPIIGLSSYEDYALDGKKKELFFHKPFTKKDVAKIIEFIKNFKNE